MSILDDWNYRGSSRRLVDALKEASGTLALVSYGTLSIPATLEVVREVAALSGVEPTTHDYSADPSSPYIIIAAHFDVGSLRVSVSTDRMPVNRAEHWSTKAVKP